MDNYQNKRLSFLFYKNISQNASNSPVVFPEILDVCVRVSIEFVPNILWGQLRIFNRISECDSPQGEFLCYTVNLHTPKPNKCQFIK
jgi:hypothetical protein